MKTETQSITVNISRADALSIHNALNIACPPAESVAKDAKGAYDLRDLLQANFLSQVTGVHTV